MAIVKYKDSKGNWVEAPEIFCGGSLKIDYIAAATDGKSYDLSKYKDCNDYLLIYEYISGNGSGSVCFFSPGFNADGSKWVVQAQALDGFLPRTPNEDSLIRAFCEPVQRPSSLDGTDYNLTQFENNVFSAKPYDATLGEAFVIYAA